MLFKNICGYNLNLIKAAVFIGCYDIFGTLMLIILEIEFFSQSILFSLINTEHNWNQLTSSALFQCKRNK